MLIVDLEWSPSGIGQHEFFLSFTKYADYKRHFIKLQKSNREQVCFRKYKYTLRVVSYK